MSTASERPLPVGRVEHIHVVDRQGAPMRSLPEVLALAGVGLDGDRYATGRGYYSNDPEPGREITFIEIEVLEALASEHDLHLAPAESRRNITTRGIRLDPLVGRRFLVGEVVCEGKRLCEPCEHLAMLTGKAVVKPLVHRGGLRAAIVEGGIIRVGDAVRAVAVPAPGARSAS